MKNLVVASIVFLSICSNLYAGDVEVEVSVSKDTCGEAGVEIHKACVAKTQEDVFRVLDINTEFISQEKNPFSCTVKAKCSFYQIID